MAKKKPTRPHMDPATGEPDGDPVQQAETPVDINKDIEDDLLSRSKAATRTREQRMVDWKRNVETRLGTPSSTAYTATLGDSDAQSEINPDWSLTKTKTANLFSQVPTVRATHENKKYQTAIAPFLKQLNYEIGEKRANAAAAMEEDLNDVVNASGIAAMKIGWAVRTVDVPMAAEESFQHPTMGPQPTKGLTSEQLKQLADAKLITMKSVTTPVDSKSYMTRLSPSEVLIPDEFTGSCFDDGDWIGHDGKMPWAEAIKALQPTSETGGPGLQPGDKDLATGGENENQKEDLRSNPTKNGRQLAKKVKYTELFYWRYRFDPEETNFHAIWRIVFVQGKTDPIIHEPWTGQEPVMEAGKPTHKLIGAMRFPIQVLTVTYISDNPVPPSDTQAGRPQVLDLRRSRLQMFQNRERSTPIRWFDVNRVDLLVQNNLMRGTYQGWIPTNGDGARSVGEIARASYPSEDLAFDQAAKQDLMELWQIGNPQMGTNAPGRTTAASVNAQQQGFATRIGQERNRVAQFFLRCCEVMAGLLILYSDFPVLTDEEKQAMVGAWDAKTITQDLVFNIIPDSTIVLDVNARIQKLTQFLNIAAKSGYVSALIPDIMSELAELSGIDATGKIAPPPPKPPDPPNLSLRLSGKEDLQNPLALAMYFNPGKKVTAQDVEEARQLLLAAQQPAQPPAQGAPSPSPGGSAAPVAGPPGATPPAPGGPSATPPPPGAGGPPPGPLNPPAEQHEDWTLNDKIMKRSRDGQANA